MIQIIFVVVNNVTDQIREYNSNYGNIHIVVNISEIIRNNCEKIWALTFNLQKNKKSLPPVPSSEQELLLARRWAFLCRPEDLLLLLHYLKNAFFGINVSVY